MDAATLPMLRVVTHSGSTYLVCPADDPGRIRVVRLSNHIVRGSLGPASFSEDVVRVELVSDGRALRLRCTSADGHTFETTAIREVGQEPTVEQAREPDLAGVSSSGTPDGTP